MEDIYFFKNLNGNFKDENYNVWNKISLDSVQSRLDSAGDKKKFH